MPRGYGRFRPRTPPPPPRAQVSTGFGEFITTRRIDLNGAIDPEDIVRLRDLVESQIRTATRVPPIEITSPTYTVARNPSWMRWVRTAGDDQALSLRYTMGGLPVTQPMIWENGDG